MSKTISLKKGLDIRLVGEAEKITLDAPRSKYYAVRPTDFHGMTPKMLVKVGETVKAGTIIFHDKYNESIAYASPVSGTIHDIVRGEKRRILDVIIESSASDEYETKNIVNPASGSTEDV